MSAANPTPGVEGFWVGGRRRRRSGPNIDVRETAIRDLPVWDTEEMRFALRSRDIAQVYGLETTPL